METCEKPVLPWLQFPTLHEIRDVFLKAGLQIQDQIDNVEVGHKWKFHYEGLGHPYVYTRISRSQTNPALQSIDVGIANHTPFEDESGPVLVTNVEFNFDPRTDPANPALYSIRFGESCEDMCLAQTAFRMKARKWLDDLIINALIVLSQAKQ